MPRPLALLAVLAVAGCGGTAAAHRVRDAQIAHRAGLTLRDLPSGFKRAGPIRQADCRAFDESRRTASARAESGPFASDGNRREVAGVVYVFAHPGSARSAFAELSSPATRSCYASRLRRALSSATGIRVQGVTSFVTRVDPLGDEQAGARFVLSYVHDHRHMAIYADLLIVRSGRGIATELYTAAGAPLDGGLRYDLTALTARRLAAELSR